MRNEDHMRIVSSAGSSKYDKLFYKNESEDQDEDIYKIQLKKAPPIPQPKPKIVSKPPRPSKNQSPGRKVRKKRSHNRPRHPIKLKNLNDFCTVCKDEE